MKRNILALVEKLFSDPLNKGICNVILAICFCYIIRCGDMAIGDTKFNILNE